MVRRFLKAWATPPAHPFNFLNGQVTMTSGINAGQVRSVRSADVLGVNVSYPWFNVASPGDGFTVLQGCDKTLNSGSGQSCTDYGNTQHYRGFPYVPQPEFAV